jgi:hypothetical protein
MPGLARECGQTVLEVMHGEEWNDDIQNKPEASMLGHDGLTSYHSSVSVFPCL